MSFIKQTDSPLFADQPSTWRSGHTSTIIYSGAGSKPFKTLVTYLLLSSIIIKQPATSFHSPKFLQIIPQNLQHFIIHTFIPFPKISPKFPPSQITTYKDLKWRFQLDPSPRRPCPPHIWDATWTRWQWSPRLMAPAWLIM